ncbi:DUF6392 family protein [Enterobacteriaceae bacterium LUAb1]
MTINVESLIRNLGKTYQEIFDKELIPYKTKPSGFSGTEFVTLNMVKEGVLLSFNREDKALKEITLVLIDSEKKDWVFPNQLPAPLQPLMTRSWVHSQLGEPDKALPPRKRLRRDTGWTERYTLVDFHIPVTLQIDYDLNEYVRELGFMPTSELRW